MIQQQRFKAACTCQARRRPGSPALQPCARSVCPAATSGVPHVPRAFAPVVRHGYAFTEARVRLTGVPSPQTCVPSPLTFPPRRASNVLPERAPLWPLQGWRNVHRCRRFGGNGSGCHSSGRATSPKSSSWTRFRARPHGRCSYIISVAKTPSVRAPP